MRPPHQKIKPCPDPHLFTWVDSREGGYWRRKRGSLKPAGLNPAFQRSNDHFKKASPAASLIVSRLAPFLRGLQTGRLTANITGRLCKGLGTPGACIFKHLNGFDLQKQHRFSSLLLSPVQLTEGDDLEITIKVNAYSLARKNNLVTHFFFDVILVEGDVYATNNLAVKHESSKVFAAAPEVEEHFKGSFRQPDEPWFLLVKVSCIEGNEMALASRNYGMKVVACGSGR